MASLFIVGIERTEFRNEIQKEIEEETHGMFMAALRFWELIEDCLKSFAEEPSAIVVDFGKEDIPIGRFMPASVLAGPARPDEIRDIGASVLDDIQSRTLDRFLRFDCDQKLERMHEDITLHLDLLHYAKRKLSVIDNDRLL